MKNCVYIDGTLPQWKSNFHMHTTRTDGLLSPEAAVEHYKNAGYHAVVISDHELYWRSVALNSEKFLVLSGVEGGIERSSQSWPVGAKNRELAIHFHGIHDETQPDAPCFDHDELIPRVVDFGVDSWQKGIDSLKSKGQLVILNHPRWSRLEPWELLTMQGYFALEVWNHCSETRETTGESEYEWDFCLRHGKKVYGVAADDIHDYTMEKREGLGGFTNIVAPNLTGVDLCAALKAGSFYASCGPEIYDMRVEDGFLKLHFSAAQAVRLVSSISFAPTFWAKEGEPLTELSWEIDTALRYVRPEIIGPTGAKAWGPPIFIHELIDTATLWYRQS